MSTFMGSRRYGPAPRRLIPGGAAFRKADDGIGGKIVTILRKTVIVAAAAASLGAIGVTPALAAGPGPYGSVPALCAPALGVGEPAGGPGYALERPAPASGTALGTVCGGLPV